MASRRMSSTFFATIFFEILQRDVDGVVERRRAARRRFLDRLLELRGAAGEILKHHRTTVEIDDLGEVLRPETFCEADRRFLRRRQLVLHAGARVEEHRQRDRQVGSREKCDVLLHAVLEHAEVRLREIGDVVAAAVRHDDVQRDDVNAGAERGLRRRRLRRWRLLSGLLRADQVDRDEDRRGREEPLITRPRAHGRACGSFTRVPRAVTPGRLTLTVVFSGGISDSGRPNVTLYSCVSSAASCGSLLARAMLVSKCSK